MLKIVIWESNPILRAISTPIKQSEYKKYSALAREMLRYIKDPDHGWVWLAAPQVGYNIRLIIVSLMRDREDETFQTVIMYNPEILEFSEETDCDREWCLSLPKMKWEVIRPSEIKLRYFDENYKEKKLRLKWLAARIVQHEIDHLDGILFIDREVK
jgi:peptide deformylase